MKLPAELKNIDFKKNPKQLTMIIAAISAALLFAFAYFLLFPQLGRLGALAGKAGKAKLELRSAKVAIANIDKFKGEIARSSGKIELYEKKLPVEQEMPSLLESLNAMAKRSKMDIISITPVAGSNTGAQKAAYQEFLIKISVRGGYHELGTFLSDIENADRFMKVVDMDIKANEATPAKHSVELLVATYILLKDNNK